MITSSTPRISSTLGLLLALGTLNLLGGCAAQRGETFASPDAAGAGLAAALSPYDPEKLRTILGPGSDDVISSGDPVADRAAGEQFVAAYKERHSAQMAGDGTAVLVVGANDWPLPIPLAPQGDGWAFDAEAGREEVIDRRIGRNELAAIDVCRAVLDAQREYFAADPDGDGIHEYAAKFRSDQGSRNGLYWSASPGEPASPLGPLAARAAAEGYTADPSAVRQAYHGYYFRILTGQGPAAPGGEHSYMRDGQMTGGFAVVAWPAEYDNSGVMTFMAAENGVVYQSDLGDRSPPTGESMPVFDPGAGWDVVE